MCDPDPCLINYLPHEIINHIFKQLPVYDLMKSRGVCSKWRAIIDGITSTETLWHDLCYKDFPEICESAYRKSSPGLSWYFLYRSLKLWPKLQHTRDFTYDFDTAMDETDEIINLKLLKGGIISVHKRDRIIYYDRNTLQEKKERKIQGLFYKYSENRNIILLLGYNLTLLIIWKSFRLCLSQNLIELQNVKTLIGLGNTVYYITRNKNLYKCTSVDGRIIDTALTSVSRYVVAFSILNRSIYLLIAHSIFKLVDKDLVPEMIFDPVNTRMYHELRKYKFLKQINWMMYFQYYATAEARNSERLTPGKNITVLFSYGLVTFAGTNWGKLYIFYTRDINDFMDLYRVKPLKSYDFSRSNEGPAQDICPIVQVDIMESVNSHILYVAMPTKITVVTIVHEVLRAALLCQQVGSDES